MISGPNETRAGQTGAFPRLRCGAAGAPRPASCPPPEPAGPPPPWLRAALAAEGLIGARMRWEPLGGGRTNRLWRSPAAGGRAIVCKLFRPGAQTPLFPNLPESEWRVLAHLRGRALAPEPLLLLRRGPERALIYSHVAGQPLDPRNPREAALAGRLLARLHAMPAPARGLRRLAAGPERLLRQAEAMLAACRPSPPLAALLAARPEMPARRPPPAGLRLLHGDFTAANVILRPGGASARMIDWQCPALGDPAEDLATFLSPAMQHLFGAGPMGAQARAAFLRAYADRAAIARYGALRRLHAWRMAAYCLWRAERGAPGYGAAARLEMAALADGPQDDPAEDPAGLAGRPGAQSSSPISQKSAAPETAPMAM